MENFIQFAGHYLDPSPQILSFSFESTCPCFFSDTFAQVFIVIEVFDWPDGQPKDLLTSQST
jgi:hypothetical protein